MSDVLPPIVRRAQPGRRTAYGLQLPERALMAAEMRTSAQALVLLRRWVRFTSPDSMIRYPLIGQKCELLALAKAR